MPLERITRAMRDATWAYVIQAYPRSEAEVFNDHKQVLQDLSNFYSISRASIQKTTQQARQSNYRSSESITDTLSGEIVNWSAEYLLELLQIQKLRLEKGMRLGQWQVSVTLGAATPNSLERLASIAVGVFNGEDSSPEAIQRHICQPSGKDVHHFHTYLTSTELAVMFQPLREEFSGYAIHDFVKYDVDFSLPHQPVLLGEILHNNISSRQKFGIPLNDLTKHGVIVGVTGSGKTTSVMGLLQSAYEIGIPFCVIEPAKTEYRALLSNIVSGKSTGLIPNLRIYCLGNETIAPFRLNPFEFETNDQPGSVSILSHIDNLKAVFNAAFILYAPMPYVLETALVVSLFCGIGGLDLGFESAGFEVAVAIDNNPKVLELYKLNFPDTTVLCRDIGDISFSEIREVIQNKYPDWDGEIALTGSPVAITAGNPPNALAHRSYRWSSLSRFFGCWEAKT